MEIRTVIVDDEPLALEEIEYQLRDFPDIKVVGSAKNGIEAIEVVKKTNPDLIFLDIQMPGTDGFGVVKNLLKKGKVPHLVFVTAYDEHAIKAFEVNAIDYLLKPVEKRRLAQAVEKVKKLSGAVSEREGSESRLDRLLSSLQKRLEPPRKLTLKVGGRYMLVDAREVIYATVEGGVISVVTDSVTGSSHCRTLEELQQSLPEEIFWRAHRSHILNINRIREVLPMFKRTYYVKMGDAKGTELPISRAQIGRMKELFRF